MAINYTDRLGNTWYFDSTGNLQDARGGYVSGGYAYTYDTLDGTSLSLYVGGSAYAASLSWGVATVSANTQSVTGTSSSAGISVTRNTYIGDGWVRMLEIVTNTGTSATTAVVSLTSDIYYDSSTQTIATASGDATTTTADDWSAFGSSYNASYPKLTHVVSGGAGSPDAFSQASAGLPVTSFELGLAAGETRVIMHFYALSGDTAGAVSMGNALAGLSNAAYLAGMTADQLGALANFTKDFTSAATMALPVYGLNLTLTGTAGISGTGNARDNAITGNAGNNVLYGQAGNDTLNGGLGNDTLNGGTGHDTYVVDAAGDVVNESANQGIDTVSTSISYSIASRAYVENITLTGGAAVTATGNAAGNVLDGSQNSGANTLAGGLGNDTYRVGAGDVVVEKAGEGTDTVESARTWTLGANLENLVLTGTANINGTGNGLANTLTGNGARNKLVASGGDDRLDGKAGADTLEGGAGNDIYYVDNLGDVVTEAAAAGTDTVHSSIDHALAANVENLVLQDGAYKGVGNALANKLTGNTSDNFLDGGAGADTMAGGAGNDIYVVDALTDVLVEAAGGGIDTVRTGLATYTAGANIENVVMLGGAASVSANGQDNRVTGNMAANTISGGLGDDTINGAAGSDRLNGGDGNDLLVGDEGGPATAVASAEAIVDDQVVALNLSAPEQAVGSVKVAGTISGVSLDQTGVNIVYIVDHSGSMTGSFLGSTAIGDVNGDGSSNTVLDAAIASVQKLNQSILQSGLGGQANVSLIQFDDTAEVLYSGAPGFDGDSNGRLDIADQLVALRAAGGTGYNAAMALAKSHLASLGTGKNIVFFLSDGDPTDGSTYVATAGELRALGQGGTTIRALGMGTGVNENPLDLLDDGIDNGSAIVVTNPEDLDANLLNTSVLELAEGAWVEIYRNGTMVDLIGSDRFTITPLGVRFESNAITLAASGTDQITARLMTMSATGAMLPTSIPIQVGDFVSNDTLTGGAGNDTLDGGAGADSMLGGLGNDTFFVDSGSDKVVEIAGEGTDLVRSAIASYTLGSNLENLELIGAGVTAAGNALGNVLTGNDRNNSLSGLDGNDTLYGGIGNDTLNGGAGTDRMEGGEGNDTYHVDSSGDYVTESSTGGVDTLIAGFNASLGGYVSGVSYAGSYYYVENLTLVDGSTAVNAVGNDQDNRLTGNGNSNVLHALGGNDTLNGGAGNDTMNGGDGNDTYHVDNAGDVLADSSGNDTVITSVNNWVLGAGFENLTLGNNSAILRGTGNASANRITGNAYANVLNGGTGADTLVGGAGNDVYYVDHAFDKVTESAGQGTDLVYASASHKLASHVENLTLTGGNGIGGAGNDLGNVITGNGGANRLLGWDGDDTLIGGGGADSLTGGLGSDVFDFNSPGETGTTSATWDVVSDFVRGADRIDLSTLDANTATTTNEAFSATLVSATGAFTAAGQLKLAAGVLYGNTDADADAEFAIELTGITTLSAADFIL